MFLIAIPAVLLGSWVGWKIFGLLSEQRFRQMLSILLIGSGLMLIASLAVNRVLQSQLVGVSPYDAATFSLAPAVLLLVAGIGCLAPVRRAMRVDPMVALRHD